MIVASTIVPFLLQQSFRPQLRIDGFATAPDRVDADPTPAPPITSGKPLP
jgi:hypothetical protein